MTIQGHVFPQWIAGVAAGNITPGSGTWKMALSNAAGPITLSTSGVSTAKVFTDWTAIAAEITGTGYTAGGVAVSSPTWTQSGAVWTFTTATNPSWSAATFSANQAVLYESSASTYQLAAFWDFGGSTSVTGATFTLTVNASGLYTATAT